MPSPQTHRSGELGPFRDVITVREDGPYEICTGVDPYGRSVTIVALSQISAHDPGRRAALVDALEWARTTAGPDDIASGEADVHGAQPWVATVDEPGKRGAERLLERLLGAAGGPSLFVPPTASPTPGSVGMSPMAAVSGPPQIGGYAMVPGQPPVAGGNTRPPAFAGGPPAFTGGPSAGAPTLPPPPGGFGQIPREPGLLPNPRKRRVLLPILAGVAVLALLGALVGGYFLVIKDNPNSTAQPDPGPSATASTPAQPASPEPTAPAGPLPKLSKQGEYKVVGNAWAAADKVTTIALPGLPFAFRAPQTTTCAWVNVNNPAVVMYKCSVANAPAGQSPTIWVVFRPCADACTSAEREAYDQDLPEKPPTWKVRDNATKWGEETVQTVNYRLHMSHYWGDGVGKPVKRQVIFQATGSPAWKGRLQSTMNDIRTQTPS